MESAIRPCRSNSAPSTCNVRRKIAFRVFKLDRALIKDACNDKRAVASNLAFRFVALSAPSRSQMISSRGWKRVSQTSEYAIMSAPTSLPRSSPVSFTAEYRAHRSRMRNAACRSQTKGSVSICWPIFAAMRVNGCTSFLRSCHNLHSPHLCVTDGSRAKKFRVRLRGDA